MTVFKVKNKGKTGSIKCKFILSSFLRAKYSGKALKTPDAIQIATAIMVGCDAILTNDSGWKAVTEIEIVVLNDFLAL